MTSIQIYPKQSLRGEIKIPGDKSISHRALIFSSLAQGESQISGLLLGEDVKATMQILQDCGVQMSHKPEDLKEGEVLKIQGRGLHSLKKSSKALYCGNSGTSMRLLMGLMAGQNFESLFTGDDSLDKRPMERILEPLKLMGADYEIRKNKDQKREILLRGRFPLKNIDYDMPVASAQLKSALILASLYSESQSLIKEKIPSRDHTETMLNSMGAELQINNGQILSKANPNLKPLSMTVPSDFSSAAFFIVAALIVPHSELSMKNINLNPKRAALLNVLKRMGANITILNSREQDGELCADLVVKSSSLEATSISGEEIPKLIDEIPIFAVAAATANGVSEVSDARELRVKESDRISCLAEELRKFGLEITEKEDGFLIKGSPPFEGNSFYSHHDHRIAMSCAIGALRARQASQIENIDCVSTSFPSFFSLLEQIST